MPTPDASAFTRQQKLEAHQSQTPANTVKPLTHLYQPIIRTSALRDFLPSFSNKVVSPKTGSLPWSRTIQNVTYIDKKRIH